MQRQQCLYVQRYCQRLEELREEVQETGGRERGGVDLGRERSHESIREVQESASSNDYELQSHLSQTKKR